jgi:hypothetical protein
MELLPMPAPPVAEVFSFDRSPVGCGVALRRGVVVDATVSVGLLFVCQIQLITGLQKYYPVTDAIWPKWGSKSAGLPPPFINEKRRISSEFICKRIEDLSDPLRTHDSGPCCPVHQCRQYCRLLHFEEQRIHSFGYYETTLPPVTESVLHYSAAHSSKINQFLDFYFHSPPQKKILSHIQFIVNVHLFSSSQPTFFLVSSSLLASASCIQNR